MKRILAFFLLLVWTLPSVGLPTDQQIYESVKKQLHGQRDTIRRSFKRLGNHTVQLESFASLDGDFALAEQILSNIERVKDWALYRFNENPQGGKYFIQINDMVVTPAKEPLVLIKYMIEAFVYKKKAQRQFRVSINKTPSFFSAMAETTKDEKAVVRSAKILLRVFPAENEAGRLWLYLNGTAVVAAPLYELLPERLMNAQAAERIRTLVENYQREEEKIAAKLNQSPKEKTELSDESKPRIPQKQP